MVLVVTLATCTERRGVKSEWRSPPPGQLQRFDEQALADLAERALRYAGAHRSRASGVAAATDAGRAALRLAAHGARPRVVARVRAALVRTMGEAGLVGLCDAGLVAVRLAHAVEPGEQADRAGLRALIARFGDLRSAAACVAEAEDLLRSWGAAATPTTGRPQPRSRPPAILNSIQVVDQQLADSLQTRIVLGLDRPAPFRRSERIARSNLPRRVIVDLDGAQLGEGLGPVLAIGRGGVERVRTVAIAGGGVRVAFDVAQGADYRMSFLPEPFRLVLDFRAARRAPGSGLVERVVVDPGHGGRNPGAKGPTGLRESDVALALARRVRHALRRKLPDVRVVLTRDADNDVSLEERAAVANSIEADLFVSIHLNASHSPDDPGGVSTFVLDTSNDEQALRLAARENGTHPAQISELQMVLASLHRRDQVRRSRNAARNIHRHTLRAGRTVIADLPDRGVKSAMFYVLVGALMPAVLVEASFITRPNEERALRTEGYRAALADGIAEGVAAYARSLRAKAAGGVAGE